MNLIVPVLKREMPALPSPLPQGGKEVELGKEVVCVELWFW